MEKQFTIETKMLNYSSETIQQLIHSQNWRKLDEHNRIKAIYEYVQNKILFGYNRTDTLTAEEVLIDGYGQCNTKATLLMALLRGCSIPCRLHGFEVSKSFQRGVTNIVVSFFAPATIIHTWAEVYYNGKWLALEGVITDKKYFEAIKMMHPNIENEFNLYAIATNDFKTLSIDWKGNSTYVQSAAIVKDFGIFASPDIFFDKYSQHWSKLKDFMYMHLGRKMMNYNVSTLRKRF